MTASNSRVPNDLWKAVTGGFRHRTLRLGYARALGVVLFFFPFSLLFVAGGLLPQEFAWMSSVVIVLEALVTLGSELRTGETMVSLARFGGLLVLVYGVEWLGVATGLPFGAYAYSSVLGPILAGGVPLAIPFAWYATVINAWRVGEPRGGEGNGKGAFGTAVRAGLLTVALDIVLEPMASRISDYWKWQGTTVPLQNYFSWFVISVVLVRLLVGTTKKEPEGLAREGRRWNGLLLLFLQWTLFAAADLVHGFFAAVVVSLVLLASGVLLPRTICCPLTKKVVN